VFARLLFLRLVTPLVWRKSKTRLEKSIELFAVTESDSGWQILYALKKVSNLKFRALMFQHALEEFYHGDQFHEARLRCGGLRHLNGQHTRTVLFAPEQKGRGIKEFLAYAHVGEFDVMSQFSAYANASGNHHSREHFENFQIDEKQHAKLTFVLLKKVVGSTTKAKLAVLKARFTRLKESWIHFGEWFGQLNVSLILGALYFLFGPLVYFGCKARLK